MTTSLQAMAGQGVFHNFWQVRTREAKRFLLGTTRHENRNKSRATGSFIYPRVV